MLHEDLLPFSAAAHAMATRDETLHARVLRSNAERIPPKTLTWLRDVVAKTPSRGPYVHRSPFTPATAEMRAASALAAYAAPDRALAVAAIHIPYENAVTSAVHSLDGDALEALRAALA